ncbi:MAG: carbohydrate kinase family protein [Clostridia bacterium]|nr:carbohydrate kinase family protein [Clostridia bacterium]
MLLFIGSAVADVVIRVPALPRTGEDLHVQSQQVTLGGCACNAFRAARLMGAQAQLLSPAGEGVWGDFVRRALAAEGVTPIETSGANGCCYCLVEPSGERTFLCDRGAEYRFRREWFDALKEDASGVYVCGLEIEEATGGVIIDELERRSPARLYFAPGPRIDVIPAPRMNRLLALHPVLHLNAAEAMGFTGAADVPAAAAAIRARTENDVIVTLGAEGAWVQDARGGQLISGFPAQVTDAIGAGDAHIGAVMACEAAGLSLAEAVRRANALSAAVVSHAGASLPPSLWEAWQAAHPLC